MHKSNKDSDTPSNFAPDVATGLDVCHDTTAHDDAHLKRTGPSKIFLPEGSFIRVLKPVVWVEFKPIRAASGEVLLKTIKPTATVASIQGFALERLKNIISPDLLLDPKLISVKTGGTELKRGRSLVDFVFPHYVTLFVHYPEDKITYRQPKSPEVDLNDTFLAIFDSEND